jgi:hypothetical protein
MRQHKILSGNKTDYSGNYTGYRSVAVTAGQY